MKNTTIKKAERPVSRTEQQKQQNAAAMPDVRAVVKQHGLEVVRRCINKLHEFDKKEQEARKLREKADAISKELNDEADALERKLDDQRRSKLAG